MQYFTGSKEHNVALRQRAIHMGFKLSEYGLFRADDDSRVAGETEEEHLQRSGPQLIPPELRENSGEIDLAEANGLPDAGAAATIFAATSTCTPPQPTAAPRSKRWPRPRARWVTNTSPSRIIRRPSRCRFGLDEKRVVEFAATVRKINESGELRNPHLLRA